MTVADVAFFVVVLAIFGLGVAFGWTHGFTKPFNPRKGK